MATNSSGSFPGKCSCSELPKKQQHIVDWFGREEGGADWRQKVWHEIVGKVFNAKVRTTIITDDDSPPSSICNKDAHHGVVAFPTDAKVQQKERIAQMKEPSIVEPGNDDLRSCDLLCSPLRADIALYGS